MRDTKHQSDKVDMVRRISSYISPLGDDTPYFQCHGMIRKATLTFAAKFLWNLVRYRL